MTTRQEDLAAWRHSIALAAKVYAAQFPDQPERLVAGQVPRRRVHFAGKRNGVPPRGQVFVSGSHR